MKEFKNKVAVITGAASGIGFGIAKRFAQEGMKVVLSGINQDNLEKAEQKLKQKLPDAATLTVQADVSKREDIETLAKKTLDAFGAVHLLVNNAGVATGGSVLRSTWTDWEWVMGVNFWGTLYGVKVFLPIMLEQDTECHIVNNASISGVLPYHPSSPYQVSKHAVVSLSENLYHELASKNARVKVSVLIPGWVQSKILTADRNRPTELQNEKGQERTPEEKDIVQEFIKSLKSAITPKEYADYVIRGLQEEKLYIHSHSQYNEEISQRFEDILRSEITL